MPTPNLDLVRKNAALHKVFVGYVSAKKLTNLYKFVLTNDDSRKAMEVVVEGLNANEKKFLGKLGKVFQAAWGQASLVERRKMAAEGLDPEGADKHLVYDRTFDSRYFQGLYFEFMAKVDEQFEKLSKSDGFLKSKPYKTYVKAAIQKQAPALRRELKLEADVDDIIGLAFAVQTGDAGSTRSLSNLVAEANTAATKKKTKAAAVISNMQKALGRMHF